MNELLSRISSLETENQILKSCQEVNVRAEVLYFIDGKPKETPMAYIDEPTWSVGRRGEAMLKAHFSIPDVEGYIRQKEDIAFLIAKYYQSSLQKSEVQKAARDKGILPRPEPRNETIRLMSGHDRSYGGLHRSKAQVQRRLSGFQRPSCAGSISILVSSQVDRSIRRIKRLAAEAHVQTHRMDR